MNRSEEDSSWDESTKILDGPWNRCRAFGKQLPVYMHAFKRVQEFRDDFIFSYLPRCTEAREFLVAIRDRHNVHLELVSRGEQILHRISMEVEYVDSCLLIKDAQ